MATTTKAGGKGKTTKGGKGKEAKGSRYPSAVRPQADLPVEFGNVSIGQAAASIGVAIDPASVTVARAHELFNGKRATVKIVQAPKGETPGQKRLDGVEALEVIGVVDIRGYRMSPKVISARLTFTIEGLDLGALAHFSKRSGRLQVMQVQEIPADSAAVLDPEDEDDDDGEADLQDDEPDQLSDL